MSKKSQPKNDTVVLNQPERAAVATVEKKVVDLKCKLANLMIQQQIVSQDVVLAEKEMIDKINDIARIHGIPPEDAGRWNFDTKSMTFTLR